MLKKHFLTIFFFGVSSKLLFAQFESYTKFYEDQAIESKLVGRSESFFRYTASAPPNLKEIEALKKDAKGFFDQKMLEAYSLQNASQTKEALSIWRDLYLVSEDLPKFRLLTAYNNAVLEHLLGNEGEAVFFVEEVIYEGEDYLMKEAYQLRSRIRYGQAFYEEALSDAEILMGSGYAVDDEFLYSLYEKLGWTTQKIISFLEKAVERVPQNALLLEALSNYYWMSGEKEKAFLSYQLLVQVKPGDIPYYRLALYEAEKGNDDQGLKHISLAIKMNPQKGQYYLLEGILRERKRDWGKAVDLITKGFELETGTKKDVSFYRKARQSLAQSYFELKDYKKFLDQALLFYEDAYNEEALSLRALAYAYNDMRKEAVSDYSDLIKKNKKNPAYYAERAKLYLKEESLKKALSDFKKAFSFDEKNEDFMNEIARLYFLTGRKKEAIPYLKKILEINPNDARLHFLLGLLERRYGKNKESGNQHFKEAKSMKFDAKAWLSSEEGSLMRADPKMRAIIDKVKLEY